MKGRDFRFVETASSINGSRRTGLVAYLAAKYICGPSLALSDFLVDFFVTMFVIQVVATSDLPKKGGGIPGGIEKDWAKNLCKLKG